MRTRSVITVALLLCVMSSPALGASFGVNLFVSVDAGSAYNFVSFSDQTVTSGVHTRAVADNYFGGAQYAAASAYASIGALGGTLQTYSADTLLAHGQATNDLTWYTNFRVTGAPGTQVQFQFANGVDAVIAAAGQSYSTVLYANSFVGGVPLFEVLYQAGGPFSLLTSGLFTFNVGDEIMLSSRLALSGVAAIEASVDIDALHTSKFYVDVLTPGGGYVTDAGVVFHTLQSPPPEPTPVPEPATLGLFGVTSLLAAAAKRRAARRSA